MEVVANQNRMRGGEARAERRSGSGGTLSYPTVWCSGRYGVTEFVVERTITFHITTRFARGTSFADVVIADIAILKTGSDLVK